MAQNSFDSLSHETAKIRIEIFTSPDCTRCAKTKAQLQQAIRELGAERFEYREVSIIEEIDYAVALGVLNASAIAIDGILLFTTAPKPQTLSNKLLACLEENKSQD